MYLIPKNILLARRFLAAWPLRTLFILVVVIQSPLHWIIAGRMTEGCQKHRAMMAREIAQVRGKQGLPAYKYGGGGGNK